jgi:CheY-like chemotaxis protein
MALACVVLTVSNYLIELTFCILFGRIGHKTAAAPAPGLAHDFCQHRNRALDLRFDRHGGIIGLPPHSSRILIALTESCGTRGLGFLPWNLPPIGGDGSGFALPLRTGAPMSVESSATTLVIEDDPDNRELLVRLLERCGLLVHSAGTVAEALAKLDCTPKVVLLDLLLPDGPGVKVLETIRARKLPIIVGVVTGSGLPETLEDLRPLSPDAVFVKPVIAADLCRWVEAMHEAVT